MSRFLIVVLALAFTPLVVEAHGIGVQAKLQNGTIIVESFFEDDTAVRDAVVMVFDSSKTRILEGRTDDRGSCRLAAPKPGRYIIQVDAGDGHLAKTSLTVPEAGESVSDGPSRETYTGATRWILALVGIAIIGGLTALAMWAKRSPPPPTIPS
jgi:nickel transport protein